MRAIPWCVAILLLAKPLIGTHNSSNEPWKDGSRAVVIDPYEGNRIDWQSLARDPRLIGIIHRASVGLKKDSKYIARRTEAKVRGYKWGSYHLGLPRDPLAQADFYVQTVEPCEGEVIALDIESLDASRSMSLAVYANHEVTKQINQQYPGRS